MKYMVKFFDKSYILVKESAAEEFKRAVKSGAPIISFAKALYKTSAIAKIEPVKDGTQSVFEAPRMEAPGKNVVSKETRDKVNADIQARFRTTKQ
jgi:hypothetical protein